MAKPKMAVTKQSLNFLYLVYFLQLAFLFLIFFTARSYFGYICLTSLALQQILSIILNNTLSHKKHTVLFAILSVLSGGFMAIVRIFSDSEKKGSLTGSKLQMAAFGIQGVGIFTLFYIWLADTPEYALFSLAASVAVSVIILLTRRDPEEKITSLMLIFLLFGYGYLVFLLASPKPYFLRFSKRYKSFENATRVSRKAKKEAKSAPLFDFLSAHGFESLECDGAKYFPTGERFFADVEAQLREAKKYIYLEFFICEDGELFDRLCPIIKERAEAGVEVRMICDDIGTYRSVVCGILPELIASGVKIIGYNRVIPVTNTFIQYRDHRKMIVIDGGHAYFGGVNIADEYINKKRPFGYWKDAGMCVSGSAASAFELAFRRQWYAISKETIPHHTNPVICSDTEKITVPYFDGHEGKLCEQIYTKIIDSAKERVAIITPYFVPGVRMLRLIKRKAREGVDISIIVPGRPDKFYVNAVTKVNSESLIKYGVKVYQMHDSFTHAKAILADSYACVGTANFDYQSFRKSSECGVITNDSEAVKSLEIDVSCVIKTSELIDEQRRLKNNKLQYLAATVYRLVSILM